MADSTERATLIGKKESSMTEDTALGFRNLTNYIARLSGDMHLGPMGGSEVGGPF